MCYAHLKAFIQSQDQTQRLKWNIQLFLCNNQNLKKIFLSISDPTTGSPTITMLRLHPSYRSQCHKTFRKKKLLKVYLSTNAPYFNYYQLPWRDGRCVQNLEHIHRTFLIYDYLRFLLHVFDLQNAIRTGIIFLVLLCFATFYFASFCHYHCNMCVAHFHKGHLDLTLTNFHVFNIYLLFIKILIFIEI